MGTVMSKVEITDDELTEILVLADLLDEETIRTNYIARGARSRKGCLALVGALPDLAAFFLAAGHRIEYEEAEKLAARVRADAADTATIFYFPGVFVVEERKDEDY